ncbi:hypothetical protein BJ741DRAFT_438280 [Chytriomyces cf. hyalinus JEL632]|nr:hypothetical protein BJ741DRAFT_438280 [Chytriomyces cf. hyalinus JEL632]
MCCRIRLSMPAATDHRLAWDIVNRGMADYNLLAMLFQASQAKGRLSKGSTSASVTDTARTQDADGEDDDDDGDDEDEDDDLDADAGSENADPALTNQAISKTPSKSPSSSTGSLSLAADAGSLNRKKRSAQPDVASIGERPKCSHTTPAEKPPAPTDPALLNALDRVVNCMDHPIENEKGAYSTLSASAQLQARVAEKVEDMVPLANG